MSKNLNEEITKKILAKLEQGVIPWCKPWKSFGSGAMPRNAISNRPYSGANVVLLWIDATDKGYDCPKWLTYKQALEAGGNVRRGEKSSQIAYIGSITKAEGESGDLRTIPFLKSYAVFNLQQCEGLDHLVDNSSRVINKGARDELVDEFIRTIGVDLRHGESRAYYAAKGDFINLPLFEAFTGTENYYATAFHELTHWTGAKHRLDRDFGRRFGDQAYSVEELVAELGSAFLCAEFGFDNDAVLDNSTAYIEYWRSFLKNNERAFVTAASAASRATEFLRGKALETADLLAA